MIGGIDRPDRGLIATDKTISWPVGLAGGFQGSLTGRENVKFVARLYSKKCDLRDKISYVEEFSELGHYFDMPIKTYSSGMRSRLGFGLSMAFKFDYYLVDEVIAVGDERFKRKCKEIFRERHKESAFLMVAHSPSLLRDYCDAAIVLDGESNCLYFSSVDDALNEYRELQR